MVNRMACPFRRTGRLSPTLFLLVVTLISTACDWFAVEQPVTAALHADPDGPLPDASLVEAAEAAIEPAAEERAALVALNQVREGLGLGPLVVREAVSDAAQNHAEYLWRNVPLSLSAHAEDPGLPGFTGAYVAARLEAAGVDLDAVRPVGEVVEWQRRSVSGVGSWLETVYHRLPLLRPEATSVGYGHVLADGLAINVLELMADAGDVASSVLVPYPPPEATNVSVAWDGVESPQPPAPSGGYPSGPVVTLSAALGTRVRLFESALTDDTGDAVPHVVLVADDDDTHPHGHRKLHSAVALYAEAPLRPDSRYHVRFRIAVGDEPARDEAWRFTTGSALETCTPGDSSCGLGEACYAAASLRRCAFEGVLPERAACTGLSDCGPGLACVYDARLAQTGDGSRVCVPYCAPPHQAAPGLPSCEWACAHGYEELAPPSGSGLKTVAACRPLPD